MYDRGRVRLVLDVLVMKAQGLNVRTVLRTLYAQTHFSNNIGFVHGFVINNSIKTKIS